MTNKSRYLITSADELTWKFDQPVLFLGHWCCLEKNKKKLNSLDCLIAKPYALDKSEKEKCYQKVKKIEGYIFPALCRVLNNYHKVNYSQKFWLIFLGHWFQRSVSIIFNRNATLRECIKAFKVNGISLYDFNSYFLATSNSLEMIFASDDPKWNNVLYGKILSYSKNINFPIEIVDDKSQNKNQYRVPLSSKGGQIRNFLRSLLNNISFFINKVGPSRKFYFRNTYLTKIEEIILQIRLGQIPFLYREHPKTFDIQPNPKLRNQLTEQLIPTLPLCIEDDEINIVARLLFDLIPITYLEAFDNILRTSSSTIFPKSPTVIFTSNNFDTDDIFKLWAAINVERGCKYFIGQHGNNYGTYRYFYPSIEELVADKFLTWGWKDGLQQHIPTFLLQSSKLKNCSYSSSGGLLFVKCPPFHRIDPWDVSFQHKKQFENCKRFVEILSAPIKNSIVVRLKTADDEDRDLWRSFDKSIILEDGSFSIYKSIAKSRLVIFNYDSTGILENLYKNIPTLGFWNQGMDDLRDSAKPYYKLLFEAGILHLTPVSAANKLNNIWDNVDTWWYSDTVQNARRVFCNRYACSPKNSVYELKALFS